MFWGLLCIAVSLFYVAGSLIEIANAIKESAS